MNNVNTTASPTSSQPPSPTVGLPTNHNTHRRNAVIDYYAIPSPARRERVRVRARGGEGLTNQTTTPSTTATPNSYPSCPSIQISIHT